jgi:hypothetical protein
MMFAKRLSDTMHTAYCMVLTIRDHAEEDRVIAREICRRHPEPGVSSRKSPATGEVGEPRPGDAAWRPPLGALRGFPADPADVVTLADIGLPVV